MKIKLFLCFFILSFQLQAQGLNEKIDAYIRSYVQTSDFSGVVKVLKSDSLIYEKAYGKATHAFHISNEMDTRFRIGGISQQFTAAAILKLEEQGLLGIEDDLSIYFPTFPNTVGIKIKHLLTHTSGIVDLFSLPSLQAIQTNQTSLSELAGLLLSEKTKFKAGTKFARSNGAYIVLAQLIEQVSHQSYGTFLKENIFKPLGMRKTGHASSQDVVTHLAIGYDPQGYIGFKQADFIEHDLLKGASSLYSTVNDLAIWISTLKNRIYFSKSFYDQFFKNYGHDYGTGISIYTSFDKAVFGYKGRVNGYIADYLHYEQDDVTIIILGNIQTGVSDFLREDIASIVFDKPYVSRAKTDKVAKSYPLKLKPYLGTYTFGIDFKIHIAKIDGILKARANEGAYAELIPLENGKFFNRTLYATIEFEMLSEDHIKTIWTNNEGKVYEGIKEEKKM